MTNSKQALSAALSSGGLKKPTVTVEEKKKISTISSQESFIDVFLDQVAVAPQVRKKLNESNVSELMHSIKAQGLKQKCEIRHFFNDEEKKLLQSQFPKAKYVLVIGHHRMEAMLRLEMKSEMFVLAPKDRYKDVTDVIAAQMSENMKRADMTIYDIANGVHNVYVQNPTWTYDQLGVKLEMKKGMVSKYLNIHLQLNDEDQALLESWGVSSLNAIYNISTMIANKLDWKAILMSYAVDDEGNFVPSKVTEKLLNKIKADLKNPPKEEPEPPPESNVPEKSAPSENVDQGNEGTFQEPSVDYFDESSKTDDVEKQDTSIVNTDDVPPITSTEPTKTSPQSPVSNEAKNNPTTAHNTKVNVNQDFLRGVAFVLGQDPDATVEVLANVIKSNGDHFDLDDVSKGFYESLAKLIG